MKTVAEIIEQAVKNGACSKSSKASDWKTLAWLFFTPQGLEFCENTNTPTLKEFEEMDNSISEYGVFVDKGKLSRYNGLNTALIGNTQGELVYDDNTRVHKVVLMHGAKAFITANNYSIVRLINIGNCEVKVRKDKTSVILQ